MDSYLGMYMTRSPSTRSIDDSIIKAQFQQKQMQEKEAKLLQMLDSQQQKALQKAGLNGVLPTSNRYSSGSNSNLVANINNNNLLMNGNGTSNLGTGKVRQMFEERRRNGTLSSSSNGYGSRNGALTGIDKGHPLEPLVVTNTNNKSRSSSSKSDPANYGTSNGSAIRNTQAPPIMKPTNLGSMNRATSLNREQKIRETPAIQSHHTSNNSFSNQHQKNQNGTITSANSNASGGGGKPYHQRQQQKNNASHPPPPPVTTTNAEEDFLTPHTTKYSDYAQELEKRENALANKLKKAHISSPDDHASNRGGGGKSPTHKSSPSPTLRSGNASPSRPNSKSPTTMSTLGSRTPTRPPKSNVRASYVKKTVVPPGKVIKSKPSAPPRSSTGPPPGLDECKICGRYFAPDRIQKHEQICKKTTTKKRKVFDPTKMRMVGTEAEPYIRVVSAKPTKAPTPSTKKADWRKKHEEFIATIRAAKEYQAHVAKGGDPKDLPPPPPMDNSDYIQCPYCNRKFSEGAAERHIPKCKNIKSNKK